MAESSKNNVSEILNTLFHGMDSFVSSKTVVGEPVQVGNATLVPLIEVSCGMGAGGYLNEKDKKNGDGGAGALSSKITPTAILVMENGNTKLVNIKNQDAMTKILDMLPDAIDKITGGNRISEKAQTAADQYKDQDASEIITENI
ncbi:MAG TPA: sporulation protein [Oribacterium sp.]|jgi:uncharacterized spore protein YtfJ|nr:sporulation protein [Oribacterium sp.]